jgi:hypothetical protein
VRAGWGFEIGSRLRTNGQPRKSGMWADERSGSLRVGPGGFHGAPLVLRACLWLAWLSTSRS